MICHFIIVESSSIYTILARAEVPGLEQQTRWDPAQQEKRNKETEDYSSKSRALRRASTSRLINRAICWTDIALLSKTRQHLSFHKFQAVYVNVWILSM